MKPGVAQRSRPAVPHPKSRPRHPPQDTTAAKPGKRKFIMIGALGLLALAAVSYGVYYVLIGRFYVSTDDAYVRANNTMLGARVGLLHHGGPAPGNSIVNKGDVIFRIDDGDYRIPSIPRAPRLGPAGDHRPHRPPSHGAGKRSRTSQSAAGLGGSRLKRAGLDFERQQALSTKGFASRATLKFPRPAATRARAVKSAQAAYDAARDNVEVTKAQQAEARAQLAELQTQLAKAERDLDFTSVRAPVDGTFSNRLVNAGDFIQAGQRLANVVPLDDVFIDANYKETQLKRIRPGQPVKI